MAKDDGGTASIIVGIAASAGGLEATSVLAQHLPKGKEIAYVVAQHMSPSHKSMLVQLLSRETTLDVVELADHVVPEPDTIYVPPPGHDVVVSQGTLLLEQMKGHPAMPKPSADRLFKSLAKEMGERAIGIVLSGTGSDGSYGIQAIREVGGITIAQEPESSKFDSMPVSAIRTGCVDLTLTPQQMGQHMEVILKWPRDIDALKRMHEDTSRNSDLFQLLLARTRVDFRQYKENTINRRIQRRMIARGIENISDYVELCRNSSDEVDALYRDLLISVTSFFRDPEQFKELAKTVKERFSKSGTKELRVWVPGCATGEEAYSVAILLAEAMGGIEKLEHNKLQIFATDIDDSALDIGRRGVYPASAADDIPPDYLARYFDLSGDQLHIKSVLRNVVMFTRHNVFQDAPFISLDLVSLRNVLIYFNQRLQERVLSRIQYALKAEGLLFLGTSESTGVLENYFVPISQHNKIYRKRVTNKTLATENTNLAPEMPQDTRRRTSIPQVTDTQMLGWERFDALARGVVTNGFLTNSDTAILNIYGDIGPYVELRAPYHGNMTIKVLNKALAFSAASLIRQVLKHKKAQPGQWQDIEGRDFNSVRLLGYPVVLEQEKAPLVLIGIEAELRNQPDGTEHERSDYLEFLESELARTKDTLNVTVEELQTSNEELQSLNEELQSSNEELQSTNEELETSNEELQSTNEELITVNEELIVNSSELERVSTELKGLIEQLPTQMLMLDQGLMIRHASELAIRQFKLVKMGHSFGHLSQCFAPAGTPPLVEICSTVLIERTPIQRQYEYGDRLFNLSVSPLSVGVGELMSLILIISAVDLRTDVVLNRTLKSFGGIGTWQHNLLTDEVTWSEEVSSLLGLAPDKKPQDFETALNWYDEKDRDMVRTAFRNTSESGEPFQIVARIKRADGRLVHMESAGAAVRDADGAVVAIVGVMRDFSQTREDNPLVRHGSDVMAANGIGFYSHDVANDISFWSAQLFDILDIKPEDLPPSIQTMIDQFAPERRETVEERFRAAMADGEPFDFNEPLQATDGAGKLCHVTGRAGLGDDGRTAHIYGSFQIISD